MAERKAGGSSVKLEKLLSNLRTDIRADIRTEMSLLESRFRTEIYRLEGLIYSRLAGQTSRGQGSWKFETPPSLGNSATAPDYAIFTDKDYGL